MRQDDIYTSTATEQTLLENVVVIKKSNLLLDLVVR